VSRDGNNTTFLNAGGQAAKRTLYRQCNVPVKVGSSLSVLASAREMSDRPIKEDKVQLQSSYNRESSGRSVCAAAGLQGIVPHDLRRSAVRNFIRAGVKESVAMRLSGHRTRSVFDRYNIVSEDDLIDASTKLQEFLVEAIKDEKVVPIQK
jgi:hypothetical protein